MFVRKMTEAPERGREGLVSQVLLQEGDIAESEMAVTWVEVEPGGRQGSHSHAPQQVYVVVRGRGVMHVGQDREEVGVGDLVFIPSNEPHHIENVSDGEPVTYVSVATPAFSLTDLYDTGDLSS